ncbi:ankyrin repeat, SAM and basic leucine zipper domain-containing protein 1-like isoform X2 [Asterias amurensis]|uniref:ankyrin repeat, SAM and basic leucine zipper domain-containing protein 1-like isoform X2 n=1 Tax=Asterias amurensis TaxID=7602 RepID=UPI003AB43116
MTSTSSSSSSSGLTYFRAAGTEADYSDENAELVADFAIDSDDGATSQYMPESVSTSNLTKQSTKVNGDEEMSVGHDNHEQSFSGGKSTEVVRASTTVSKRDKQGIPLVSDDLRLAVCQGNIQQVQYFLDKGLSVDVSLRAGWTALMYAASSGHAHIVEFLLDRDADANFSKATYMYTPLIAAASSVHAQSVASCVTILLQKGADPNMHERSHMTPLMFVSKSGVYDAVLQLLNFGAEINHQDNRGWTALCYAAEQGFTTVVKCLIDNNADTQLKCSEGKASDVAYNCGHYELAELIRKRGDKSSKKITIRSAKLKKQDSLELTVANQVSNHCSDDLDLFLFGLDLGNLVPVFRNQEVSFAVLLNMSEADLEKLGIDKYGWRCKIVNAIHEVHKRRWEPGSVRAPQKRILSLFESRVLIHNISTHVTYIGSSMKYVGSNWMTHGTLFDRQQDPCNLDLLMVEIDTSLKQTTELFKELKKLKEQLLERQVLISVTQACVESIGTCSLGRKLTKLDVNRWTICNALLFLRLFLTLVLVFSFHLEIIANVLSQTVPSKKVLPADLINEQQDVPRYGKKLTVITVLTASACILFRIFYKNINHNLFS